MNSGPDHAGTITVKKLGTKNLDLGPGHGYLISDRNIKSVIEKRDINSHKGMFGKVLIIGGAEGMCGAPILTGRAAIKLGAGKVQIGILDKNIVVDFSQPDIMIDRAENLTKKITKDYIIIIGPGLGKTKEALTCLERCIKSTAKLIVDADALNLIAENKNYLIVSILSILDKELFKELMSSLPETLRIIIAKIITKLKIYTRFVFYL